MKTNIKTVAVTSLVVFNVALAGGVAGAYLMHTYDQGQAHTTQSAIQAALKSVPVAQASK